MAAPLKRLREDADSPQEEAATHFESSSIEDRASRFVALFSPVTAPKTLQAHPPYKSASHRILAWRRQSKQQSLTAMSSRSNHAKIIYDTGSDDDGEKYAGKRLERLLIEMDVVGSIVVARWYGGVLLGPVRFDHIVNVAKEAIQSWQDSIGKRNINKKPKVLLPPQLTLEQQAEQKQLLVKILGERDNSITVLRELLAETKVKTANSQETPPQPSPRTMSVPDYSKMPLATLRKLETAKDNTIAWILKQIDEAEGSNEVNERQDGT